MGGQIRFGVIQLTVLHDGNFVIQLGKVVMKSTTEMVAQNTEDVKQKHELGKHAKHGVPSHPIAIVELLEITPTPVSTSTTAVILTERLQFGVTQKNMGQGGNFAIQSAKKNAKKISW